MHQVSGNDFNDFDLILSRDKLANTLYTVRMQMAQKEVMRVWLLSVLLVACAAALGFQEPAEAAEQSRTRIQCPCKGFTCALTQNCNCLTDERNGKCSCSCHERMVNIPERPVPRLQCKCKGFTCSQAESCRCVKRLVWPQDEVEDTCSCSCLRSTIAEPTDQCSCENLDYACKSDEVCTCVSRQPLDPNCTLVDGCCSCSCTKPKPCIPQRRTVCPCEGYSCKASEKCHCVEKLPKKTNSTALGTKPIRGICSCSCRELVDVHKPQSNATSPSPPEGI